jgi:hypothetical protein
MKIFEFIITAIGVSGAFASIIGATLSIRAKKSAEKSAEQAESAKNLVLRKQTTTHLAEILFQSKIVQQSFGKYTITQSQSLIGAKFENDAEVLQSFIFVFNEHRALIEDSTEIQTEITYKSLNELLDEFMRNRGIEKKKTYGKQIRLAIDDIIFKMKKVIDNRNKESK